MLVGARHPLAILRRRPRNLIQNASETWVEGNRVSYNRGVWGTTPGGQQPGPGINLTNLIKATIFDNCARGNSGADLNLEGRGENCVPVSACQK